MKNYLPFKFFAFALLLLLVSACDPQNPNNENEQDYEPDPEQQFIVTFPAGSDIKIARDSLRSFGSFKVKECMCGDKLRMELWQSNPGVNPEETVEKAKNTGTMEDVERNAAIQIGMPHPLPQEFVDNDGVPRPKPKKVRDSVLVALLDTGFESWHDDLQAINYVNYPESQNGTDDDANCLIDDQNGFDFFGNLSIPSDINGHGTHVAGTISRDFPPSYKLAIINEKIHSGTEGYLFDAICATHYAISKRAKILNLSWGYYGDPSPILKKVLEDAGNNDILIVCSAGNDTLSLDKNLHWPSNFGLTHMIVVGAFDNASNDMAAFSNFSSNIVDILANGVDVTSSFPGNSQMNMSGTSMSAAEVSRTAAWIRALQPGWSAGQVKGAILDQADKNASLAGRARDGNVLNHANAVASTGVPPS